MQPRCRWQEQNKRSEKRSKSHPPQKERGGGWGGRTGNQEADKINITITTTRRSTLHMIQPRLSSSKAFSPPRPGGMTPPCRFSFRFGFLSALCLESFFGMPPLSLLPTRLNRVGNKLEGGIPKELTKPQAVQRPLSFASSLGMPASSTLLTRLSSSKPFTLQAREAASA